MSSRLMADPGCPDCPDNRGDCLGNCHWPGGPSGRRVESRGEFSSWPWTDSLKNGHWPGGPPANLGIILMGVAGWREHFRLHTHDSLARDPFIAGIVQGRNFKPLLKMIDQPI
jgi:hypothetical protein